MVTILLRLLMVQMAIQLTMATALEGQTSHYVKLMTASTADSSTQIIKCPVYSIKPANQTIKFTKYIAEEKQFQMAVWTPRTEISTFKECAEKAVADGDLMFMWADDECSTSENLFSRRTEPCNDDTSTLVYIIDPPETSCVGTYLVYLHKEKISHKFCSVTPGDSSALVVLEPSVCINGKIIGKKYEEYFSYDDGAGCLSIEITRGSHSSQDTAPLCGTSKSLCYPKDEMERPAYLEILKDMALAMAVLSPVSPIMVPLNYDNGQWKWSKSDVVQPDGEENGWKTGYPKNSQGQTHGYMTHEGLVNYNEYYSELACCYQERDLVARVL